MSVVALLFSELRRHLPERCFAARGTALPGQLWIDDLTGREPGTALTVYVRDVKRSRGVFSIRIRSKDIRVFFYIKERTIRSVDPEFDVVTLGETMDHETMIDNVNLDRAPYVARLIARLVKKSLIKLPALHPELELDPWRIV